ncbi:MAG: hypothetical protein ACOC2L_02140, partial [Candidatus Sumerlaeota bacterium]
MQSYYRAPQVEQARRNIILQNRAGNRLTLLMDDDQTELEFVYKPNAFRRKDHYARNFSNRDNFTKCFADVVLPDIQADFITTFDYDPFVTRLKIEAPSGARNKLSVVNVADENAFVISARAPLLVGIKPQLMFEDRDGMLLDEFEDRGERIVSFIAFPGYEKNRYRVMEDGTHVLQILENDVVVFGAEDSRSQAERVSGKLRSMSLDGLIRRNEEFIQPVTEQGRLVTKDEKLQRILDLNQRVVYSGIDEGGACFGALNRIYHLIWVRDGSMTTALSARSGNPEYLKKWAPFLMANPSVMMREDGSHVLEYLQIVGSRWTKSEDDGIFYAALTLFTYFQTTGDDSLIRGRGLEILIESMDRFLEKAWEEDLGMIGSDTRGEESLKGSPYYGYDIVNGMMKKSKGTAEKDDKVLERSYSLYNQVNVYNTLLMLTSLLNERPELDGGRSARYMEIAAKLQETIDTDFLNDKGCLKADRAVFDDGTVGWIEFEPGADYWEYAWAVSLGPFFPAPEAQLRSARKVPELWPQIKAYGYCPWNTLARTLREHGMDSKNWRAMLDEEIEDALMLTEKYPTPGALTEYQNAPDGWRALPFSAGSLFFSASSLLLQSLPFGIAVRAST